jgi:hypothetical protein
MNPRANQWHWLCQPIFRWIHGMGGLYPVALKKENSQRHEIKTSAGFGNNITLLNYDHGL